MGRDWIEWHRRYDDPNSSLSQRLTAVAGMIRGALDAARPGPIHVLSLCAGDGRDLVLGAAGHARAADLDGRLVERDPDLAEKAASNIAGLSSGSSVLCADAAETARYVDALPVDLLLLCGIFGNVSDDDIERTIAAVPAMCSAGATVIWTRHRRPPDITPTIRELFDDAGCRSLGVVSPGEGGFAVGGERVGRTTAPGPLPERLFTFRDDLC
jgi:hypothetical protein